MDCTLMHKNIPVADMSINDRTAHIADLRDVYDIRHLPVGVKTFKTDIDVDIDIDGLDNWWIERSIPASRDGIQDALQQMGVQSPQVLILRCYGLSLSDQYWICPKDSGLCWENVNFFQNDFSKDVGEILFGNEPVDSSRASLISPDNTSDGIRRKKWIIADRKRFLMKGGSGVYQQEPFNEVIASALMRRLHIAHVNYTLTFDNGKPYSLCENFVTPDTELIPAAHVHKTCERSESQSKRDHFLHCCKTLGVPDVKDALNKMLTLDYIISNEDRHFNNFGLLRNADTLEWIGFAPVFDSGTSLWYETQRVGSPVKCKPFHPNHEEQIKLVSDFSWFDARSLDRLDIEVVEILSKSEDVDENRRNRIAAAMMERVGQIEAMAAA